MSLPRFFLENQVLAAETEAVFPLRLALDDAKHALVLYELGGMGNRPSPTYEGNRG